MFKAILIEKDDAGYRVNLTELNDSQLPEGDVTVSVQYSTLNYKDALALTNKAPICRQFPMVPGVDFVGIVEKSQHAEFKAGDAVVLNSFGVGESHWGGLSQKARVKGDWLIPLPKAFSPEQAMGIATAGYTAMLCVLGLEKQGVKPSDGEIVVTGAGGGVGGIAISILSKLGYKVVAITGRPEESEYLKSLGAVEILDRKDFDKAGRPLGKERWAGAVDTVGGHILANVCATTKYEGVVTACGLASTMDFPATVAPFILRGVKLIDIDSVYQPKSKRIEAWNRLATDLDPSKLGKITKTISLEQVGESANLIIEGKLKGRVIVDVNQ